MPDSGVHSGLKYGNISFKGVVSGLHVKTEGLPVYFLTILLPVLMLINML